MARILLVEPDYVLAKTYHTALTEAGHNVTPAAGAQSALIAADRTRPELIILELQLIEHSGIEFLYEFRSYPDWQDIPVLLHTHVPPAEFNESKVLLNDQLKIAGYLYKSQTSLQKLVAETNRPIMTTA
jgi:DNA-binding response OmpR family regulator